MGKMRKTESIASTTRLLPSCRSAKWISPPSRRFSSTVRESAELLTDHPLLFPSPYESAALFVLNQGHAGIYMVLDASTHAMARQYEGFALALVECSVTRHLRGCHLCR